MPRINQVEISYIPLDKNLGHIEAKLTDVHGLAI